MKHSVDTVGHSGQQIKSWRMKAGLLAVLVIAGGAAARYRAGSAVGAGTQPAARALTASAVTIPLFFEPNQGQTDSRVKFLAHGSGYGLFLTADEAVLDLRRPATKDQASAASVIRMRLDGANTAAAIRGDQRLPGTSSYFIGNDRSKWRRSIPQFAHVEYKSIYPGVDLVYYGNQRQLEYDFHVAPKANPDRIAITFQGANARLESGDLVLATSAGDVRFHAPRIYQPAAHRGSNETAVSGSFRQMAANKIGFALGSYDRSRELVIDPVISYSTFLGGSGTESLVKVAVDSAQFIYVAGSTNSNDFPTQPANNSSLTGIQNVFVSKINPTLGTSGLVNSFYLGSTGTDNLAGVAVDQSFNIYVAGTTISDDFPTTANAFQTTASGTHGFVSKLSLSGGVYDLAYSTYLAGDGVDSVTGLAVDLTQNAYVTGVTNSTVDQSNGFPANPNGYQLTSNSPGNNQFFATKINTTGSGFQSVTYSTYFGGGNPPGATVIGGGIAVDASGNMYFTGSTNMLQVAGPNGEPKFPLLNAFDGCLNQNCTTPDSSHVDAVLVKLNPNLAASPPFFSTYLGGTLDDIGTAVAVDGSSNSYVTGYTNSSSSPGFGCVSPCILGPYLYAGGLDAFIAKVGNQTQSNTVFPLNYFTYLGGSGDDQGQAIVVDSLGTVHLAGSTTSADLPITQDALQTYGGQGDAFAALIATSTTSTGDYVTYLGGSQFDQGSGIAIDNNNTAYVAGITLSDDFPVKNAYQPTRNSGSQDAFVTKIANVSTIAVAAASTSPSPNPVAAGTPVAFTFDLTNTGTDPATNVTFQATVPTTGISTAPTAKVTSGGGSCTAVQNGIILCNIANLAVNATAAVEVDVTPAIQSPPVTQVQVQGAASANGGSYGQPLPQIDSVVDFSISASPSTLTINAGDLASFPITLAPNPGPYTATITMSETTTPSIVTQNTPTFTNPTVSLGTSNASTTLNIQTVPRPVTTGSVFHHAPIYAALLPVGGLSLLGLGLGAGRRRRILAVPGLLILFGLILLQPACSSSSSAVSSGGGTLAGKYVVTVTGSAGTGAAHSTTLTLFVN